MTPAKSPSEYQRGAVLELLTLLLLFFQLQWTFRLWLNGHAYPQIPWFRIFANVPAITDRIAWWGLQAGMLTVLAGLIIQWASKIPDADRSRSIRKWGWGILLVCLTTLMLLDQNRLQVWAWQVMLYGICFLGLPVERQHIWLGRLTIAIYFYSAVSKLDYAFLDIYGQTLLNAVKIFPVDLPLTSGGRFWLAALFPLGELAVAGLLLSPRSRRFGWYCSLLMHISLILVLGPLGLNHHPPVMIWNFFFLLQNCLLFTDVSALEQKSAAVVKQRSRLTPILLTGFLLLPATEWFHLADGWPSWGLYSARGARVRLYIAAADTERLPTELKLFVYRPRIGVAWRHLDLHRWSLAELNVPCYPEDRFQLGVAWNVLQRLPQGTRFLIIHQATAQRWTGRRTETQIQNLEELETFGRRYRFNWQMNR